MENGDRRLMVANRRVAKRPKAVIRLYAYARADHSLSFAAFALSTPLKRREGPFQLPTFLPPAAVLQPLDGFRLTLKAAETDPLLAAEQ